VRERLEGAFFKELKRKTYNVMIDRRIIKAKGMLLDATMFPKEIKYPNDLGLEMVMNNILSVVERI